MKNTMFCGTIWENGVSLPDAGMVVQLAEVLDTTVNILLGEEIPKSEESDYFKTLAAKLEVLNEQYSQRNQQHRRIWRIVFTAILIVSAVSLIRYTIFFSLLYQAKDISVSSSVTVISGSDAPVYFPFFYFISVLKPIFICALAIIISIIGLCRTRKT